MIAIAANLPVATAFLAFGAPLLDPLSILLRTEEVGILVVHAVVVLALAWMLLARWRRPAAQAAALLADPIVLLGAACGAVLWIGAFDTPTPLYARLKILGFITTNLLLLIAGAALATRWEGEEPFRRDRRFDAFLSWTLVFTFLIALAGFWNYQTHFYRWSHRLMTLGIDPIWFARTMAVGLLAIAGLRGRRRLGLGAALLLAAPFVLAMALSGSRGPSSPAVRADRMGSGARADARLAPRRHGVRAAVLAVILIGLMPEQTRERFVNPLEARPRVTSASSSRPPSPARFLTSAPYGRRHRRLRTHDPLRRRASLPAQHLRRIRDRKRRDRAFGPLGVSRGRRGARSAAEARRATLFALVASSSRSPTLSSRET